MTKKTIIFVFLIIFLNSVIVPNYASAMGQSSTIPDLVGWGLLAGFFIVLGIFYYHHKASKDPKEDKKENKVAKKMIEERVTPAGDLVLLKW